jgi:hypothetical protein
VWNINPKEYTKNATEWYNKSLFLCDLGYSSLLKKKSVLIGLTLERRARTIRPWFRWIRKNLGIVEVDNGGSCRLRHLITEYIIVIRPKLGANMIMWLTYKHYSVPYFILI